MPRTPLAQMVQTLFRNARQASARRLPVDALIEERQVRRLHRREFLGRTVKAGALALGGGALGGVENLARAANRSPKVAIIGAGLAGLTCAYRLRRHGIHSVVYEAAPRLG